MAGLSSRRYEAGLEPVGELTNSGTSRSAVSRRLVAGTRKKLTELFGRDLSTLALLAVFLDGVNVAEHCVVMALGVDSTGRKHPLGLLRRDDGEQGLLYIVAPEPDCKKNRHKHLVLQGPPEP